MSALADAESSRTLCCPLPAVTPGTWATLPGRIPTHSDPSGAFAVRCPTLTEVVRCYSLAFGAHDVGLPDQVTLTLARSVFVMRCLRLRCALLLPERDGRTSCCGRVGSRDACARPRPLHCRIKHADLQSPSTLDLDCSSVYVLSQCADMGCGTCREWVLDDAFHLVARTPLRL